MAHDTGDDNAERLSPRQAASLLGVNWRTVRRWIDNGKLEGTRHPCTTTRAAVEACKAAMQPRTGEVLSAGTGDDSSADNARCGHCGVVTALTEALSRQDVAIERLAREVGRLEAELAQARGAPGGHNGHKGHADRALARLVPWLRG